MKWLKKFICKIGIHNYELTRTDTKDPIVYSYRGKFWHWVDYYTCKWCGHKCSDKR